MRKLLNLTIVLAVIAASGLLVAPSAAQSAEKTYTLTEAQINAWYRITNPIRRSITKVVVDLVPGSVRVLTDHQYRNDKTAYIETTLVATITDGRLYWTVTSRSRNGESVPQDVLDQINRAVDSSWRVWIKGKLPNGVINTITISDTEVVVTYTARR